jgi:hypothetical protein
MWRRVVLLLTDVSEEHIATIFRVEKSASDEPAWANRTRHKLMDRHSNTFPIQRPLGPHAGCHDCVAPTNITNIFEDRHIVRGK